MMPQPSTSSFRSALWVVIVLVALLSWWSPGSSARQEARAAGVFPVAAALGHVEQIAARPRPMGSEAHARARDYLVRELEALGLEVEVQRASSKRRVNPRRVRASFPVNVIAHLPGSPGGQAVVFVSHYDSAPMSPGAADDGAAVAAMLELARSLTSGDRLRNDVVLLFTDGEEAGLVGARAFVDSHPLAQRAAVFLNFEARGSRGPVVMFEASPIDGPLVRSLSRVRSPVAYSFSQEVYRRLPNDTDATVFLQAEMRGLNFAFFGDPRGYHRSADTVGRLDPDSLQHMGGLMFDLAEELGNADLTQLDTGRASVYFTLPGGILVHFPILWIQILAGLALLGWVLALVTGGVAVGRVLLGALGSGLLAVVVGGLALALARFADPGLTLLANGWLASSVVLLGIAVFAVGLGVVLVRWLASRLGEPALTLGGLGLWTVLAILAAVLAPGASYLWILPLLPALAGRLFAFRSPRRHGSSLALVAVASSGVVAALLWIPTYVMLAMALGLGAAVLVAASLAWILGGLLGPLLAGPATSSPAPQRLAAALPYALSSLGLFLVLGGAWAAGFGSREQIETHLLYAADLDEETARWLSLADDPDPYTRQALGDAPQREPLPNYLNSEISALSQPADLYGELPAKIVASAARALPDGGVALTLSFESARDADELIMELSSPGEVVGVTFDGERFERDLAQEVPPNAAQFTLAIVAAPEGVVSLEVELARSAALHIELIELEHALPAGAIATRPPGYVSDDQLFDSSYLNTSTSLDPAILLAGPASPAPES